MVYLAGIKTNLNINDFNHSSEINGKQDLREEMEELFNQDPFEYFDCLVNTIVLYELTIINVKPEEKLVYDILLDIENWLKELYVVENQKSFSIPCTWAISSLKISMEMLMNSNPNVQAKDLSLEEMKNWTILV